MMPDSSFNLTAGSLYRSPLNLAEGDQSTHGHSWDLGYHHAKRSHGWDPGNPAIGDPKAYEAGYKHATRESQPGPELGEPANSPEPSERLARPEFPDEHTLDALRDYTNKMAAWKAQNPDPGPEEPEEPEEDDDFDWDSNKALGGIVQSPEFIEELKAEMLDELRTDGLRPGAYAHMYDDIHMPVLLGHFMDTGRAHLDGNRRLRASWDKASKLEGSDSEEGRDAYRNAVSKVSNLMVKSISKLGLSVIPEEEQEQRRSAFVQKVLGMGVEKDFSRWAYRDSEGGDYPRSRKNSPLSERDTKIIADASEQLFDAYGPIAEAALRKLKTVIRIPDFARAECDASKGYIAFRDARSFTHEMGHMIEKIIMGGRRRSRKKTNFLERSYWANRVLMRDPEPPVRLSDDTGIDYKDDEWTRRDEWGDSYMGKVSGYDPESKHSFALRGDTEIVSMLSEALAGSPQPTPDQKLMNAIFGNPLPTFGPSNWEKQFYSHKDTLLEYVGYVKSALRGAVAGRRRPRPNDWIITDRI